jgi:adenylate kinase
MEDTRRPNILVTGTPGTGKTTTCEEVAAVTGLQHINIGEWVKQKQLHSGWDAEHGAYLLDEDKVCDALEDVLEEGGVIVDHHGCDFFPERWFDLVIVLQTDNSILYERLQKRNYPEAKISENIECEIMHVIVEEAYDSYREEIIQILASNTVEEMDENVERIVAWVKQYETQ